MPTRPLAVLLLLLAGCAQVVSTADDAPQRHTATGVPLSAEQMLAVFADRRFASADGTVLWHFGSNGEAEAMASTAEASVRPHILAVEGDKLCRGQGVAYVCGLVYRDGDALRVEKTAGVGLAGWTMQPRD